MAGAIGRPEVDLLQAVVLGCEQWGGGRHDLPEPGRPGLSWLSLAQERYRRAESLAMLRSPRLRAALVSMSSLCVSWAGDLKRRGAQ